MIRQNLSVLAKASCFEVSGAIDIIQKAAGCEQSDTPAASDDHVRLIAETEYRKHEAKKHDLPLVRQGRA